MLNKKLSYTKAFTIVELLVVIVVIGILAAITIVSYSGITNRANIASIQAELSGASKKLAMYYAQNGFYPATLDGSGCPLTPEPDVINCIKFGGSTTYTYNYKTPTSFELVATRGSSSFKVTENSSPTIAFDPADWITIGTQTWAKKNINVGTMITGATNQTNNGGTNIVEKYCYGNNESNCTTYGGLYQWDEAMGYATSEGSQGICPTGSHIPSDNDWKILEMNLGMTKPQADAMGLRGTDQGTQMKVGGASGFNELLGGFRETTGDFVSQGSVSYLWASSLDVTGGWRRALISGSTVNRDTFPRSAGYSIRCLGN